MINKNQYLNIIKSAIRPPENQFIWKNDPFDFLLSSLKKVLLEHQLDRLIPCDSEVASTSSTPDSEKMLNSDARIQYAHALGGIYLEFSSLLRRQKAEIDDEYHLLSLQDLKILCESLQFFVLTAILPFLQQGVGLGAAGRSNFVKSWKIYDGDVESQRENLSYAAKVLIELVESNEALKNQVINKFIDDFYALRFQLLEVSISSFDQKLMQIIANSPKNLQISSLMGLLKPKKGASPPKWLESNCGEELSRIQMENDGVWHFLAYYSDIGGENWVENVPLRQFVAKQFGRRPKNVKNSVVYHSNIFQQFLRILKSQKNDEKGKKYRNILLIFVAFIEEIRKINQRNVDFVVYNYFFKDWEYIHEKMTIISGSAEKIRIFQESTLKNLELLAEMLEVGDFQPPPRLLQIYRIFLNISEDEKCGKYGKIIVKNCLKHVSNPGKMIFEYLIKRSRKLRICEKMKKSILIQEIGEEDDEDSHQEMWLDESEADEIGVARRLESIDEIMAEICEKEKIPAILLEILAIGVKNWMEIENEEKETMRFVENVEDFQQNSLYSHLIVGFCFEKIGNGVFEGNDEQLVILLKIVENVLEKSIKQMEKMKNRIDLVDLFQFSENDRIELETMLETVKMSIGLTSGVLIAASFCPQVVEKIEKTMKMMRKFVEVANKCLEWKEFGEDVKKLVREAEELLNLMDCGKVELKPETSTSKTVETKVENFDRKTVDLCEELIEDLKNEEPALCGASLIQISRIFKNSNRKLAEKMIEMEVFEKVEKLLANKDSYIFLAAINCLGEMACYDRKYLKKLMELYGSWTEKNGDEETIRRGRIGEVLGKIFRTLGEVSIIYVDEVLKMFINGLKENEEIIRASCCTALGDVILASNGRGIEKSIDEILYLLENVILIDSSFLVRRAAVDLFRQMIKSTHFDVLQVFGEKMRDIRRKMMDLWKFDRDSVVQLHAQLCVEEITAAIQGIFEEEESRYFRKIKI